jgi:hypothetical protein
MSTIDSSKMDKYVDGVLIKKGKEDIDSIVGKHYWWKASDEAMANQIAATIKFIQSHQPTRIEQLIASTRLYGNSSAFNFIGPALARSASSSATAQSNRISFNLCSSVVDTLTSKIAKNKVIPSFITSGGVWGMQKKAENLSKFLEGCFYQNNVHKKGVIAFRDGAIWGTGIVFIYNNQDSIEVERVLPHEIYIDQIESLDSAPRQMHRAKLVDRDVLLNMFELSEDESVIEAIKNASPSTYDQMGGANTAADLLTVTESWHLRSGKDMEDGVHAICLDNKVLFKEQYDKDYFPFAFFKYNERPLGFWGQGAVERLQNLQGEINRLMVLIQRSMWMGGSFKVLVENGSKVVSQHLNNDVGAIIHYTGTPPQYITPPMIQQDIYPYVDALIAKGYQQEGVSQLAASSLKPQGIDSGAALRAFNDIAEDRQLFIGQEMEAFYLEIGRQMIEVAKEIYSKKKTFKVVFPSSKFMETIDWKDIKLKEDEYVLKAFPTSSLPDDPSGKLQTIQEYMQAGLITPRSGRRLMTMPDVEMSDKLANAAEDLICKIIEDMLEEDGTYRAPEPYYDLQLAKQLSLEYYNYADLNNAPEEKLELLRRFMTQIDDLTGVNNPQAMPPQGQPLAAPEAPPVSALIPNAPGGAI